MKICITNKRRCWDDSETGKGRFIKRLIPALEKLGCKVTVNPEEKVDLTLGIGKFEDKPKGKAILRLGDAHKDINEDYKTLNKRKKEAMKYADGVIYQSNYSKKLCRSLIGDPKCHEAVIFNGADPEEFNVCPYISDYKYNFLASARIWTPQKRFKYIKTAFIEAEIKKSCLWVCGAISQSEKEEIFPKNSMAIRYLGTVKPEILASLYKLCDAMIDITWLSACPNNVVESLVAGCPVFCTDQSGAIELTEGWIADEPYKFKPVDLSKPPKIITSVLARLLKMHVDVIDSGRKTRMDYSHLYINNIAKQYYNFFKVVLNG